jgi:hypothetical protein
MTFDEGNAFFSTDNYYRNALLVLAENARGNHHSALRVGLLLEQRILEKCLEIRDIFLWHRSQSVLECLHEIKRQFTQYLANGQILSASTLGHAIIECPTDPSASWDPL